MKSFLTFIVLFLLISTTEAGWFSTSTYQSAQKGNLQAVIVSTK